MATAAAVTGVGERERASAEQPAIRLEAVEKVYTTERIETVALSNANLEVRRRELLAIMGPSGCGKSTLLHLMGLLDVPTQGRVALDGRDTSRLGDRER